MADRDDASDVTLYSGAAGTTFSRVRVSADGLWIAAIVTDGTGTDVLAVADQAPYAVSWRTSTPSEVEVGLDWPD